MSTSGPRLAGLSLKGFAELSLSDSQYQNELWPQLDSVIDVILNSTSDESRCVSFEENYSTVYKMVCKGYGHTLYEDLIYKKVDKYIERLNESLEALKNKNLKEYIEKFSETLNHFRKCMHSVLSIFVYLNRCVLNNELESVVYSRFNERLVSNHVTAVLDALEQAEYQPFAVEPSTSCNIIKSLYQLNEEYGKLNSEMFQKFIPGYIGSTRVGELVQLSEEAKAMSQNLRNIPSFQSNSRPLNKRSLEGGDRGVQMDDT